MSISYADKVYAGGGYSPGLLSLNERRGVQVDFLTKVLLGSPAATLATGIVNSAATTNLPNATTMVYTPATSGTAPLNSGSIPTPALYHGVLCWPIAVPRAMTCVLTNAVAGTVLIAGYDKYGEAMSELFTFTTTGTTLTVAGKKAFAYIKSLTLTTAGNWQTSCVLTVGWNDVLGLPYKVALKSDLLHVWFNDVVDTTFTLVLADVTSPATTSTGDVRGTIDNASACDGSAIWVWLHVADPNSKIGLVGVAQA
jgi:hypothetical protein